MTPLNLIHPIAAAIHARPPESLTPVWIFVESRGAWCILRAAATGERITTLCLDELPPDPVHLTTHRPHNSCPACETELAAWTPGAAVAFDPGPREETLSSRVKTADLRPGGDGGAWIAQQDWEGE